MAEKNVRIRLFKDNSRYKGDLFVSVNGVNYKIRRGVEVEVPPAVAEVLEHSQRQDELTAARIAAVFILLPPFLPFPINYDYY